jgi:hypothetical protein
MDEPKIYPLPKFKNPHRYPVKRVSFGPRQVPREAEKARDGPNQAEATSGHPKPDLPADGGPPPRQTGTERLE